MDEEAPPPPSDPAPAPEENDGPLRLFLGLFLVPLLVVLVCVGVFVGFGWIAYERQTLTDYVDDLQSGWRPRRAQAAYEISKILISDPDALDRDPAARGQVRMLFETTDDPVLRRYLALVLGRSADPGAVPLLVGALGDPDSQTRIYALLALGETADARAVPPLTRALADDDPGVRKTAAHALGALGDPSAIESLRPLLADPVADVRWNAALGLARLGSDAGVDELRRMLDRELTGQVAGITAAQQEEAMVSAVRALAALGADEASDLIDRLAEDDPSFKVRQAAIEARRVFDG